MFTFGLFSTHMPYVVMVVFYAVYFLFSTPAFKNGDEIPPDLPTDDTELAESELRVEIPATDFVFTDYIKTEENVAISPPPLLEIYFSPPNIPLPFSGLYSNHFCRPPPVIS
jgi:hypothetical protein